MDFLLHIAAGAGVGFAIGLTGVGGGSLMTPLLLFFGYPAPVAIGTDLLYAALTKSGGAVAQHRAGNVDWKIVGLLAAGSIPISILLQFTLLGTGFQESPGFESLLTTSLGIMLIITASMLLLRDKMRKSAGANPNALVQFIHKHRSATTWIMGMLLGACVTLSSVGAGAFAAAILLSLYTRHSAVSIVGTDIAHAVPLTFIAGIGYLLAGYVDVVLLVSLLIGSLPAIHLGSRVSASVPDKLLQRVLILFLLSLGVYYSAFSGAH